MAEARSTGLFLVEEVRSVMRDLAMSTLSGEPPKSSSFGTRLQQLGELLTTTYADKDHVIRTDVTWAIWIYGELVRLAGTVDADDPWRSLHERWRAALEDAFGGITISG